LACTRIGIAEAPQTSLFARFNPYRCATLGQAASACIWWIASLGEIGLSNGRFALG
jgi:hypothetical protein